MNVQTITNNSELQKILSRVNQECANKEFSDIVDDKGHQYVDLVMEGGGMLGIGLLGYTYVLEQAGIRFLGIGGTSAGSINALLLAALGTPEQEKGGKLLDLLANKNFMDFIDGDSDARDLLKSWLNGAGKFKLAFKAAQVIDSLQDNLGLNPGDAFTTWLKDILRKEGIESNGQLQERMRKLPSGLRNRAGEPLSSPDQAGIRLAMIAADVTTETRVCLKTQHVSIARCRPA